MVGSAYQFWQYLKPHISVVKDCGSGTDCYNVNGIYLLNGNYKSNPNTDNRAYKFILSDGGVMYFATYNGKCTYKTANFNTNACASFIYDINGDNKPNTYGKDIFAYVMTVDGVYPNAIDDCYKDNDGFGCAAYIIKHGNMNYLH